MNIGSHLGQYRILRKIGAGGMGTVYLGEHILLGRRAAIKTLLPALSVHKEIVERFFNEARATSAITDHGVVQIFDFGYHVDGTAYIVMELLEGESLQTRIERLGKIAPSDSLRIARMVAGSLAAAHAHDIVHRDLKPENIFLIHDGEAQNGERTKILDFGICKLGSREGDPVLTQTGTTMGTPVYMSPEQCRGAGHVDQRSDIYALGCVLFHMLTGRPPFECEGAGEFIVAHLQEEPPIPSSLHAELPALIDDLLARCLEKAPDDRFQTMTELQHALEYVLARISAPGVAVPPMALPAMPIGAGYRSSYDLNIGTPVPTQNLRPPSAGGSVAVSAAAAMHDAAPMVASTAKAQPATKARRKSNTSKSNRTRAKAAGSAPPPLATGSSPNEDVVRSGSSAWFVDPDGDLPATPTTLGLSTGQGRVTDIRRRPRRAAIAIVLFGLVAAAVATLMATQGDDATAEPATAPSATISTPISTPTTTPTTTPTSPPTNEPAGSRALEPSQTHEVAPSAPTPTASHTDVITPPASAPTPAVVAELPPISKDAARPIVKPPAKITHPNAKPRIQRRPPSTPHVKVAPPDPAPAPSEDLYDTR